MRAVCSTKPPKVVIPQLGKKGTGIKASKKPGVTFNLEIEVPCQFAIPLSYGCCVLYVCVLLFFSSFLFFSLASLCFRQSSSERFWGKSGVVTVCRTGNGTLDHGYIKSF